MLFDKLMPDLKKAEKAADEAKQIFQNATQSLLLELKRLNDQVADVSKKMDKLIEMKDQSSSSGK